MLMLLEVVCLCVNMTKPCRCQDRSRGGGDEEFGGKGPGSPLRGTLPLQEAQIVPLH